MSTGNILLQTDVYKLGHMHMYPPGTTKVYSYLCARSLKMYPYSVFFGLSYFLQEYLSKHPTREDVDELMQIRDSVLGPDTLDTREKLYALVDLGYWPIKIE